MRYIKLYEEFKHDEIYDVMMSICDTVSFKESEVYPSTEYLRVFVVEEKIDFEQNPYDEYLSGWDIVYGEIPPTRLEYVRHVFTDRELYANTSVVFCKGSKDEAALAWLKEVYGNLERSQEISGAFEEMKVMYKDADGKVQVKFDLKQEKSRGGYYYVSSDILFFFYNYLNYPQDKSLQTLLSKWLSESYGLKEMSVSLWW